jgi:aminobenzoyl-glutamate utilization protein B
MSKARIAVQRWVDGNSGDLSEGCSLIWNYGETAWREYKSARWYVDRLRAEGFEVEEGSGGMPTAFAATFSTGKGPVIGGYAEYDGVPGNCQAATTREEARAGLSPQAGGHTDPHSALGMGALGGFLAAKAAMREHGLKGTLKFFGEPAEKVRGSKPIHAARGYYDGIDAFISFHPAYILPLSNTVLWDTHCGASYAAIYSFHCDDPENWLSAPADSPIIQAHSAARAPGATDALVTMYNLTKMKLASSLPFSGGWTLSEAILTAGQATADNLPAGLAQIQYLCRVSEYRQAEQVFRVLDQNAEAAALAAHCRWERHWVCKSREGLPNHAMAELTYRNLCEVGGPVLGDGAIAVAREIQARLGLTPMDKPFMEVCEALIDPREAERIRREDLPASQRNSTSDDYTEMCWHAPTVRLYIGRPMLKGPPGYRYPAWAMNALGGIPETIDPTTLCAAKVVGLTVIDLLSDSEALAAANREFEERTGGGIGGENWIPPLCDYEPPIHFRWPEYVTTERGEEWWIPAMRSGAKPGAG